MSKETELAAKFWKSLKSDRTAMVGLVGTEGGRCQPLTAQIEGDGGGSIWFFTSSESDLVAETGSGRRAILHFASKSHDLFASVEGRLTVGASRATIRRLWNPFVAAWFRGADDPKIRLLRFEAGEARIWLNQNGMYASVRMPLGGDPRTG